MTSNNLIIVNDELETDVERKGRGLIYWTIPHFLEILSKTTSTSFAEFLVTDPEILDSIPGAASFSEK
jgi:hypothetical protein